MTEHLVILLESRVIGRLERRRGGRAAVGAGILQAMRALEVS